MKTRNSFRIFALVLVFTGFAACQNTEKSNDNQQDSASKNGSDSSHKKEHLSLDRNITQKSEVDGDGAAFMDAAAVGGMMEVDLGKLALEKSANARVKQFAALMVADHTKANADLKAVAEKLYHLLPSAYPADVKVHMDEMKKLDGKQFDAHYMDMMVNDHAKTLNLFRSASSLNTNVKDFAARTLPVLEKHDRMAKDINASLK